MPVSSSVIVIKMFPVAPVITIAPEAVVKVRSATADVKVRRSCILAVLPVRLIGTPFES